MYNGITVGILEARQLSSIYHTTTLSTAALNYAVELDIRNP